MGCFNKTGFFSHLPITAGDDIFVLLCSARPGSLEQTPVEMTSSGLTPLALPFFGQYDDYGNIEKVIDDPNHMIFRRKFSMSINEFGELSHDMAGKTIADMLAKIKKIDDNPDDPYTLYEKETTDTYKKLMPVLEEVIEKPELMKTPRLMDTERDMLLKNTMHNIYESELKDFNNTTVLMIMDHKFIYDRMVEYGREHYTDGWYGKPVMPNEAFDNTLAALRDTVRTPGKPLPNFMRHEMHNPDYDKLKMFFGLKCCLYDTVETRNGDYGLYNNIQIDEVESLRDAAIDYVYFLRVFKSTCCRMELSPYHNQMIDYKALVPVYREMLAVVEERAAEEEREDE